MSTNSEAVQASVRAQTGTLWTYEGDWHALFDLWGIALGTFNERMLAWLNAQLGTAYVSLPQAQQAFAAGQGVYNWSSMGTFTSSSLITTDAADPITDDSSALLVLG